MWNDPDRNYGPPLPRKLKQSVIRAHKGVCHWCLKPGAEVVDHIVNRRSGGSDDPSNLAPIHGTGPGNCHSQKTAQEANAARAARKHRKPPQHPGRKRSE